jgi:hypothetical protein
MAARCYLDCPEGLQTHAKLDHCLVLQAIHHLGREQGIASMVDALVCGMGVGERIGYMLRILLSTGVHWCCATTRPRFN